MGRELALFGDSSDRIETDGATVRMVPVHATGVRGHGDPTGFMYRVTSPHAGRLQGGTTFPLPDRSRIVPVQEYGRESAAESGSRRHPPGTLPGLSSATDTLYALMALERSIGYEHRKPVGRSGPRPFNPDGKDVQKGPWAIRSSRSKENVMLCFRQHRRAQSGDDQEPQLH